mgnify:CR=1 FL=1
MTWRSRVDAASYANRMILSDIGLLTVSFIVSTAITANTIESATGFTVAGGATAGQFLRGDGVAFVPTTIQPEDLPSLASRGDIVFRNSSNITARLAVGAANTVLQSNGLDLGYGQVTSAMLAGNIGLTFSATAPTIAAGFGTSPVVAGTTAGFTITVGTGGTASTGTITFPTAPTGWIVQITDITNNASFVTSQTGGSTTTATVQNYSRTTGSAIAWTAGDVLRCTAVAY